MQKRIAIHALWLLMLAPALLAPTGCAEFAETSGVSVGFGTPEGADGYSMDYRASAADVWEVFRLVARDNGEIDQENPDEMSLEGKRINRAAGETSHDAMRGRVYDKTEGDEVVSRLIVHVWYPGSVEDNDRWEIARSYCFAVQRELIRRQGGGKTGPDESVVVGTEPPVGEDEAVGYFKVSPQEAWEVLQQVIKENGELTTAEADKLYAVGKRKSKLEPVGDEVRARIYDRTEESGVRCKVSIQVRSVEGDKPRQETAKAFVRAVREELEKRHGGSVE